MSRAAIKTPSRHVRGALERRVRALVHARARLIRHLVDDGEIEGLARNYGKFLYTHE